MLDLGFGSVCGNFHHLGVSFGGGRNFYYFVRNEINRFGDWLCGKVFDPIGRVHAAVFGSGDLQRGLISALAGSQSFHPGHGGIQILGHFAHFGGCGCCWLFFNYCRFGHWLNFL